ncbi:hypothetical protein PSPO01_09098 [Paraphaeosphaeria sporulosa]
MTIPSIHNVKLKATIAVKFHALFAKAHEASQSTGECDVPREGVCQDGGGDGNMSKGHEPVQEIVAQAQRCRLGLNSSCKSSWCTIQSSSVKACCAEAIESSRSFPAKVAAAEMSCNPMPQGLARFTHFGPQNLDFSCKTPLSADIIPFYKPLCVLSKSATATMPIFVTIDAACSDDRPFLAKDLVEGAYPLALVSKIDFAVLRLDERIKSAQFAETGPIERPPSKDDRHKFTLWRGTVSSPDAYKFPWEYAFREHANLALMATFQAIFEHLRPLWSELETHETVSPAGFGLQFVGVGEAGWSLDQHGCLALAQLSRDGSEIEWLYVKAEVGDNQAPLPAGNMLPINPLPTTDKPLGFKKFSMTPKTRR